MSEDDFLEIDGDNAAPAAPVKKKGGWPKGQPRKPRAGETPNATLAVAEVARPQVRERKRKGGSSQDRFWVDPTMIPPGMSWEWKRESVFGRPDVAYSAFLDDQGWLPVEQARFPNFPIRRDGMILMERPIELTREAQAEDRAAARDAVIQKERQLREAADGEFQRRRADGSSTVSISTTIERGVPIDG
jgi:hypothetical protein